MSMTTSELAEAAKDIVKDVTELNSRAGLAAMHYSDPSMRNAPIPCAWVLYVGMSNNNAEPRGIPGVADVTQEIVVKILLAYNTESDLLNIQYPVLDAIREAMISTKIDASPSCEYFKFEQETLEEIDDRLVYVQRYSFNGNL